MEFKKPRPGYLNPILFTDGYIHVMPRLMEQRCQFIQAKQLKISDPFIKHNVFFGIYLRLSYKKTSTIFEIKDNFRLGGGKILSVLFNEKLTDFFNQFKHLIVITAYERQWSSGNTGQGILTPPSFTGACFNKTLRLVKQICQLMQPTQFKISDLFINNALSSSLF